MRRKQERVVVTHRAELLVGHERIPADTQDLSPGGVFVRTTVSLPVGTIVEVALDAGRGPVRLAAEIAHVIGPEEAAALGRSPGLGLSFAPAAAVAPGMLVRSLAEFLPTHRLIDTGPVRRLVPAAMRAVVADESPRLLERVATALGQAGFQVITCATGGDAFASCLSQPPDVVLSALHLPGLGGLELVQRLGQRAETAAVPVALMSHDSGDIARLRAYQMGVSDFIPKPFTVAELCIRVRRLARARHAGRVELRGSLEGLGLGALLTLFEAEQKTGVLTLSHASDAVWITLRRGRLKRARSTDETLGAEAALHRALDWPTGHFELAAGDADDGEDELDLSVMHLLLEHARVTDERARA